MSSGEFPVSNRYMKQVKSTRDELATRVRQMIRRGVIASGMRIDQRALAKELDVTTSPLREVLSALEAEGLIERIPGSGLFCRAYTVDEIEEMSEVRAAIEGVAARRAAQSLTPEMRDKLYALAHKISDPSVAYDEEELVRNHIRFHRMVAKVGSGRVLLRWIDNTHLIDELLANVAKRYLTIEPHDHIHLVDAIASGDPERAERAMREHAADYLRKIRLLRDEYGDAPIMPDDRAAGDPDEDDPI